MRRTRRGCLAVFALLIGLIAGTTPPAARSSELEIATQPISYDALAKVVRDLKGKVVIVDFWAEYCSPCKEELKELLVLQKKYGHDSLALLTVSLDDPKDKEARDRIGDFLTQQQADCTSYILDTGWQEWQKKLKIAGPPCLYLFNRENYYVRKFTGEINPEVIKSEIAELINGRTSDKNAAASDELIDFRVAVLPPDPFSERNQFGRPVTFQRGEVATIVLNGMPKPGYHTYPLTQRTTSQSPGTLSRWQFVETANLRPLWPITETRPRFKQERTKDVLLEVEGAFTWSRDILILPDARPASTVLSSTIQLTACNEDNCTPCKRHFDVPITITNVIPLALSTALRKRLEEREPAPAVVAVPGNLTGNGSDSFAVSSATLRPEPRPSDRGLLGLILTTMGAAIAMLFTPCVFPMVPITVSFFLKQSEREQRSAWLTALVYSATIIVVLTLSVLILGKLIVDLANSAWMNLGLGLVLVFFAFSLFGMYEIELPHYLSQFTSSRESKGGSVGAVFMALTFTITSFTCTGPFLGPLLVATKEMQLGIARLVLAAFVYSATFASPFFVLALFPALLKRLPKSGGWLNAVKVVMGFLELAAALKFLTNMDASLHPGNPWIFTYDSVICAWIALSMACGLYLLGVYRLPHDTPLEHIGVPRLILATFFIGLGLYMIPPLWGRTPQGIAGRFIIGLAPLNAADTSGPGQTTDRAKLHWFTDYGKAREKALAENKLLFLDFTGVNCQNCRANEAAVFSLPEVREQLNNYICVQLYTDAVPNPNLTAEAAKREAEKNSTRESETFREISTPLYVIFQPDKNRAEENGKLLGVERGRAAGYIKNISAFVDLLKKAQNREVAQCN